MSNLETRIPPPLYVLIISISMWMLNRGWGITDLLVSPYNKSGLAFMALGIAMVVTCFFRFRRSQTTIDPVHPNRASQLVTSGLFKYSRNPMYLGMLVFVMGWATILGTASPWIGPIFFYFWITRFQIIPEERALREKFGGDYDAYCDRVGRWIF